MKSLPQRMATLPHRLSICLISDNYLHLRALRTSIPAPHEIMRIAPQSVLVHEMRKETALAEALDAAHAILVDCNLSRTDTLSLISGSLLPHVPLIACFAANEEEQIYALNGGADECLIRPFGVDQLRAAIIAHLRRVESIDKHVRGRRDRGDDAVEPVNTTLSQDIIRCGPLLLDRQAHRLCIRAREVKLSPKEIELLYFLMRNENLLVTRDQMLRQAWNVDFDTRTNRVAVYIHYLREALEPFGMGDAIQTVRGKGYRFIAPHS